MTRNLTTHKGIMSMAFKYICGQRKYWLGNILEQYRIPAMSLPKVGLKWIELFGMPLARPRATVGTFGLRAGKGGQLVAPG